MSSPAYNLPSSAIGSSSIAVPTSLKAAGATINAAAATITGELESLKAQIAAHPETWTGKASTDFEILKQEWDVAAQGLFGGNGAPGVLGEIAQAMNVVYGNYTD